jgi:PST family polysaccharide transporter
LGSGVGIGARAGGALVLNKLLALYGGPGGLTLLAHFQNLLALFTTLPNDGVHVGVVKYLAPLRAGTGRYRAWFGAGIILNILGLLLGGLALLLAPGPLVGVFQLSAGWTIWFFLGIGMLSAHALLGAVLLAAGRLRTYVWLAVTLSFLGVGGVAGALALGWPIEQVLLTYLVAQSLTLFPAVRACGRAGLLPRLRGRVSKAALRGLSRFLLMAGSLLLFGTAVNFAVREVLIARFGLAQTDLWQAVAKVSDNYTMVFTGLMSSVYYPRLAALSTQPAAQRAYVRTVVMLLAPVLAVGLGLLYLLRDWLLPFLFDEQFAAASYLFAPQLLGDWVKFLTWLLLFLLTAKAQVGRYIAVQAGSAMLYVVLLQGLLPHYGLLGAPLAHAGRFGVLLLLSAVYFRSYLRRDND